MKKFTKISLIIVACLIFMGIFFLGIGFAIGGRNINTEFAQGIKESIFSKDSIRVKYQSSGNNNIGNIDFGNWELGGRIIYQDSLEPTEIASKEDINKVICKVGACNFEIIESQNDNYIIESTTIGSFRCYQDEDILYFEGVNENRLINSTKGKIKLYIPKGTSLDVFELRAGACALKADVIQAKLVTCDIGAGEVSIGEIIAEDVDIEIGAGEVTIENMVADTYDGEIGAGEIMIFKADIDRVETNVGMGNAEFDLLKTNACNVDCAMGNIEIRIDGKKEDYGYSLKCVAGNVSIGNNDNVVLGSIVNNLDADKMITADCAMGNIAIKFSQ